MSFFKNVFGSGSSSDAKRKQEQLKDQQTNAATEVPVRRVAGIASIQRRIEQSDQRNRAIIQNVCLNSLILHLFS